jgi:hypothetical protein
MGIAKGAFSLLFELKTTENLHGTVCQLGRQTSYVSEKQVRDIAKKFGFPLTQKEGITPGFGFVNDEFLFLSLGFDDVQSIDYDNYEKPTHILDLNNEVPEEYNERYDVIYDGGTSEHIFNLPQCLKNIYKMLKPNGIIIHGTLPVNNWVDHGFYQFSPTLFHDYYSQNNWEIVRSYIFELPRDHATQPWLIYKYDPRTIRSLSSGGCGDKRLGIWFVAKKSSKATGDVIPMQGAYLKTWKDAKLNSVVNSHKSERVFSQLKARALKIIKKSNVGYLLSLKAYALLSIVFKKRTPRPKAIAKY